MLNWCGKCAALVAYIPKRKAKEGVNLLEKKAKNSSEPEPEKAEGPRPILSYLKPNLTIHIVDDFQTYKQDGIPPQASLAPAWRNCFCKLVHNCPCGSLWTIGSSSGPVVIVSTHR